MVYGSGALLLDRPRRAISIGPHSTDSDLPELDVVGLIRVLDNPEDLEYFDRRKGLPDSQQSDWTSEKQQKCLSNRLYWTLIGAVTLSLVALIGAAAFIWIQRVLLARNQNYVKRWIHN